MYVEPGGQGWTLCKQDGRPVLVHRFALTAEPIMVVRTWAAPGLRDWLNEDGTGAAIGLSRDGRLYIERPFGPLYFVEPRGTGDVEPLSQVEEPLKAPRGKWRWSSCGRWKSLAKR